MFCGLKNQPGGVWRQADLDGAVAAMEQHIGRVQIGRVGRLCAEGQRQIHAVEGAMQLIG